MNLVGFVDDIQSKSGIGRNGKPYTLYNVSLTQKDGQPLRVGWGFDAPSFQKGVWVKTEIVQKGQYLNYEQAPIEVAAGPQPSVAEATVVSSNTGVVEDVSKNIHYQNSRTAAIALTDLLIRTEALPLSEAKAKAGVARRFEQVNEYVDKITVKLFHDLDTFRLLDSVADFGDVEVPKVQDVPVEVVPEPEEGVGEDDIPF